MTDTNTTDLSALISRLDELDGKRTRGPWKAFIKNGVVAVLRGKKSGSRAELIRWAGFDNAFIRQDKHEANAAFIVALENLVTLIGWPKLRAHLTAPSSIPTVETIERVIWEARKARCPFTDDECAKYDTGSCTCRTFLKGDARTVHSLLPGGVAEKLRLRSLLPNGEDGGIETTTRSGEIK